MGNGLKILMAENDPQASSAQIKALREQGYEIDLATDAMFVLTMALRNKPNAIILGARLPAGGALKALRRLRSSVHTAAIPIIAISEEGSQTQELLAAGAEQCLELPIEAVDIVQALEAHLGSGHEVKGAPSDIINDPGRLTALESTGMLDSDPDEALDIITRLAAKLLNVPVALVSLVDNRRQFFKSQVGLPSPWDTERETPLSHSFCQWVVSSDQELSVSDARKHQVLSANGAVADLGVIAYAGVPLKAATGETIGSFCAVDTTPHEWNAVDLATLRDFGQIVDAYSALNQLQSLAEKSGYNLAQYRFAVKTAARGFLGSARLLNRYGNRAEELAILSGIIERHSQQLIDAGDMPISQLVAA